MSHQAHAARADHRRASPAPSEKSVEFATAVARERSIAIRLPAREGPGRRSPERASPRTEAASHGTDMVRYALTLLAAAASVLCLPAQAAEVKQLFAQELKDYPGKQALMLEVTYLPGDTDIVHRHDAEAFVYVLEGEIVMQLKGQEPVHLKAGQTFHEGPDDIHLVGRNASAKAPARFVVVLLKKTGAPVLTPVPQDGK